jgi:four helix bundle protein
MIADCGLARGRDVDPDELRARTKQFGLRCMKLAESLPKSVSGRAIAAQLIRSGTSVGANYRAACRARSPKDFVYRMNVVEEEADEAAFWMELIIEGNMKPAPLVRPLHDEAEQIVRIAVASARTAGVAGRPPIRNPQSAIRNS